MHVYYCKSCKKYFFISSYWYQKKCKACNEELTFLPISFAAFVELDEVKRREYIQNFLADNTTEK